MEKITALIFGILALVLEVFLSIKNPTVESIVAAAFAAMIVVCAIVSLCKVKTLVKDAPKSNRPVDKAHKLANEIAPYIKEKNGKISIKVIK